MDLFIFLKKMYNFVLGGLIMENDKNFVPSEVKKWNWGAFMYNILWGIGNRSYLPLLCLIPLFNIIWIFVCGAKGNSWAWKKGNFESVDEFMKIQNTWSRAGLFSFILTMIIIVLYLLIVIFAFIPLLSNYGEYYNY